MTNGSLIISNANSRAILTRHVINWLGQATTNSFTNASLLIIHQLGVTNPATRFVVREKIKGAVTNFDVTPFFTRTFGAPQIANTSLNTNNGALNGTFYGGVAFRLQDATNYPALKGHLDVGGFRITTFTTLENRKHEVIGLSEQGSIPNAFGKGDIILSGHERRLPSPRKAASPSMARLRKSIKPGRSPLEPLSAGVGSPRPGFWLDLFNHSDSPVENGISL